MTTKPIALTCCLLYACIPTIVLFTATSADILFTPLTITTLFLFWRAIHRRSIPYALAAGIMYGLLHLTSFSLIGIGAFFGFTGLWRLWDPRYRAGVVQTAALMIVGVLFVHGAVWWWSGFNVIEVFQLSKAQFDLDQVNLDKYTPRYPGWAFRIINPICWFFFAGIPVSVLFLKRLLNPANETKALFIVFALTLIALNFLYLGRGEGERSAMYIMPFLALPAAHMLHEIGQRAKSFAPLAATLAFLAFQCWLIESYFYTYW